MIFEIKIVRYAIICLWFLLLAYWTLKSFGNKKDKPGLGFWMHNSWPVFILFAIAWTFLKPTGINQALFEQKAFTQIAGIVLGAGGVIFGVWARKTLSTNWSAQVVIKENHQLITTGPYALVRHPIYTGFITTLLGTIIAINISVLIIIAWIFVILYLWLKLKKEEKIISAEFPKEYSEYKKHVPAALLPYLI